MKAYPTYKESSIDWIGRIPSHWETKKGKYLFDILSGDAPAQMEITESGSYAYIKVDDLNTNDTTLYITEGKERFENVDNAYDEGVIVFPKRGAAIFTNKVKITKMQCLFDTNLMGLKVFPDVANKEFVAYCLLTRRLDDIADTSTVPQINNKHIYPLEFPFPKPNEQQAIADFLDRKTAQIDTLIEKKQRQIDLLQEQRTALINHAVTRGLNPDVRMKNSGVEWLGEIPSHWKVAKLSYLTERIGDGLHGTPEYVDTSDYYFINGNNLVKGEIQFFESTKCVSEDEFKKYDVGLNDKTILLSINGTIGNVAFYRGEKVMLGKSAAFIVFQDDLLKNYFFHYLQSTPIQNYFGLESTGTTIYNLSLKTIRSTPLPLPPDDEKKAIADYLNKQQLEFDKATDVIIRQIDTLKEYRTALISEAVTGKIDVRTAETVHESPTGTM